ncbi:hypothetical protein LQZ18_03875 [Lachnospiraceae bacterium ZAX-1]
MKNTKYFPFERNKYFYGKLLSVDDFELEQRYMNDKRRMLNRFLNGTGIVAGLSVVLVDEQTISIESGIALDSYGREMVIDRPLIKKLEVMEGFSVCTNMEQQPYVYLCMDYGEEETDRVHNIAQQISMEQDNEHENYNKIRERYRLYLTVKEPEYENLTAADLYEETKVLYWKNEVRIKQIMPRYVQAGHSTQLRIEIENFGRNMISFSYDLILNALLHQGQPNLHVSFDEMLVERTGSYSLAYTLDTVNMSDVEGLATIDPQSVNISFSGRKQEEKWEHKAVAAIGGLEEKEELIQRYYRTALDTMLRNDRHNLLYLARIFLISTDNTYMIDRIENAPFSQHIRNHVLEDALDHLIIKELKKDQGISDANDQELGGANSRDKSHGVQLSKGTEILNLGIGGRRGDRFFSGEVVHGLGLGRVTLVLGIEKDAEALNFGSSEIFERDGLNAEIAAKLDPEKGSFIIGARLLEATMEAQLKVHWTAIRDMSDVVKEQGTHRIFIKPNVLELHVRESYHLEAVCENMVEKSVKWSVKEEGGEVDANGLYVAPNLPGVYEVVVCSVAFPDIKASIFIVVRDHSD